MSYEDLIQSMEVAAREKMEEILETARRQSEGIQKEAEDKAHRIRQDHMDRARQAVTDHRNRLIYQAREEIKSSTIREKEKILDLAFARSGDVLAGFRNEPGYPSLFSGLLSEALLGMQERSVHLHIDKRDESLSRGYRIAGSMKSEIMPDLSSWGGVRVTSADEKIVIHNTLESRLQRARLLHRRDISRILFGE